MKHLINLVSWLALMKQRHAWRICAPFYPVFGAGWFSWFLALYWTSFLLNHRTIDLVFMFFFLILYSNFAFNGIEGKAPNYIFNSRFHFFMQSPGTWKGWYYKLRDKLSHSRAAELASNPSNREEIMRKYDDADAAAIKLLKRAKKRSFYLPGE